MSEPPPAAIQAIVRIFEICETAEHNFGPILTTVRTVAEQHEEPIIAAAYRELERRLLAVVAALSQARAPLDVTLPGRQSRAKH